MLFLIVKSRLLKSMENWNKQNRESPQILNKKLWFVNKIKIRYLDEYL